ncbi:MAG: cytochrome c biogenesis CcdA family protein [Dehalococcoidia bacterium]
MARSSAARTGFDRRAAYAVLALLFVGPLLVFGIGGLAGDSIGLEGPGGPLIAFSAGVLSFVSPCVLPLVPVYVTHLSGSSIENGRVTSDRRVTFSHALAFVAGLSFVFIALGTTAGLFGSFLLQDNQQELQRWAGYLLAIMGIIIIPSYGRQSPFRSALILLALTALYFFLAEVAQLQGDRLALIQLAVVMGFAWLRFAGYLQLSLLSRTVEVNVGQNRKVGYTRSGLLGGAWALGWTPCVGPVLANILTLAGASASESSNPLTGTYLLAAYSAGLSIPFLITGLAVSDATRVFRKIAKYTPYIEVASGVMFIAVGFLLWQDRLTGLNEFFSFAEFNQGL